VIAAIVLAAGASTRLGRPKQLVVLGGETLLERAVRTARKAACQPVVVVLGAEADQIRERCNLSGAIRVGVGALPPVDGVVLMTCDQPAVTAEHLRALMAVGDVAASAYAGRCGVPAYFPAKAFAALMELWGDAGARGLLREAATVDLDGGELDVDTAADLDEAKRRF